MGAGLIDDFIHNILSVPFCPCHFVHTILSNAILSVYYFVHTILSVPFCPLPFCPRTLATPNSPFSFPATFRLRVAQGNSCKSKLVSVDGLQEVTLAENFKLKTSGSNILQISLPQTHTTTSCR